MLTDTANQYLQSLYREESLPVREVEQLLVGQGVEPYEPWLAFHQAYAGYFQDLGMGDVAVWGLARLKESTWFKPRMVNVQRLKGTVISVYCADVHGSHGYSLRTDGRVEAPTGYARNFDIHVERLSLWRWFALRGRRQLRDTSGWTADQKGQFAAAMDPFLRTEASDEFTSYYVSDQTLFIQHAKGAFEVLDLDRP
jgi:hypothetical protein